MKGFDILDINKLFEIKSTIKQHKCLYDYVVKRLISMNEPDQLVIFKDEELSILRFVMRENIEAVGIKRQGIDKIQKLIAEHFNKWDKNDKDFYKTLEHFNVF